MYVSTGLGKDYSFWKKFVLIFILSACSTGYYIVHTSIWQRSHSKFTRPFPVPEQESLVGAVIEKENHSSKISIESTSPQAYNLTNTTTWLREMGHIQRRRRNITDQTCSKHRILQQSVDSFLSFRGNRGTLFANDQHKIIFSKIHKVASNHFTKLWKILGGLKSLYKEPRDSCVRRIEKYYRVIFVRHPLSRILSAYRDKFERHNNEGFRQLAEGIKRRQRTKFSGHQNTSNLSFEEFVRYLVNSNSNRGNSHWSLISSSARVCELRYDFVGRLETLNNDLQYLLYKLEVNGSLTLLRSYYGYNGDIATLRHYYGNISRPLLSRLHKAYKMDFDMFGYNMDILGPQIWPKQ